MYWESILDPNDLFVEANPIHIKLIQKLRTSLKSADFAKKQARHPLYSVKLNDEFRVVFAHYTDPLKKTSHLLVLEIFDGAGNAHKRYERFLSQQAHKKQLDLIKKLSPSTKKIKLRTQLSPTDSTQLAIENYVYYGQQAIQLSEDQEQALTLLAPTLIEGPPGSGKTVTALQLLKKLAMSKEESDTPVIYLAPEKLRFEMREKWQDMAVIEGINPYAVLFIDPDELVKYCLDPHGYATQRVNITIVGESCFTKWFKNYKTTLTSASKDKEAGLFFKHFSNANIYRDFKIIAAIGAANYSKLGERVCRAAQDKRQHIIACFTAYHEYLQSLSTKTFDPAICEIELDENLLDEVVVDESQSIPPCLLKRIIERHNQNNFCFMDTNQVTDDIFTAKRYLQKLTHRQQFTKSYRVPREIAAPIQRLLTAKYTIAGGQADIGQTYTFESNIIESGKVNWVDDHHEVYIAQLKQQCQHPTTRFQTAVVIFEEKTRDEVSTALDTQLIFTPREIQGFEFPYIILWKPFEVIKKIPFEIWANISTIPDKTEDDTLHGTRESVSSKEEDLLVINKLFIAMSRSLKEVTFYVPNPEKAELRIIDAFKQALHLAPPPSSTAVVTNGAPQLTTSMAQSSPSQAEEIPAESETTEIDIKTTLDQVKQFILNNKIKLAQELFDSIAKHCKQSFAELKKELKEQQQVDMQHFVHLQKPQEAKASSHQQTSKDTQSATQQKKEDIAWLQHFLKGKSPEQHLLDVIMVKPNNFKRIFLNSSETPQQKEILNLLPKIFSSFSSKGISIFKNFLKIIFSDSSLISNPSSELENFIRKLLEHKEIDPEISLEIILNSQETKDNSNFQTMALTIIKELAKQQQFMLFLGKISEFYANKKISDGTDEDTIAKWHQLSVLGQNIPGLDNYLARVKQLEFSSSCPEDQRLMNRDEYQIFEAYKNSHSAQSVSSSTEQPKPIIIDPNNDYYRFRNEACLTKSGNVKEDHRKLKEIAKRGNPVAHHLLAMHDEENFQKLPSYDSAIHHFSLACFLATNFEMSVSLSWLDAFATALRLPSAIEAYENVNNFHKLKKQLYELFECLKNPNKSVVKLNLEALIENCQNVFKCSENLNYANTVELERYIIEKPLSYQVFWESLEKNKDLANTFIKTVLIHIPKKRLKLLLSLPFQKINTAFLTNDDLKKAVRDYTQNTDPIDTPQGFIDKDKSKSNLLMKLIKSLTEKETDWFTWFKTLALMEPERLIKNLHNLLIKRQIKKIFSNAGASSNTYMILKFLPYALMQIYKEDSTKLTTAFEDIFNSEPLWRFYASNTDEVYKEQFTTFIATLFAHDEQTMFTTLLATISNLKNIDTVIIPSEIFIKIISNVGQSTQSPIITRRLAQCYYQGILPFPKNHEAATIFTDLFNKNSIAEHKSTLFQRSDDTSSEMTKTMQPSQKP